jgi:hypothetical protein
MPATMLPGRLSGKVVVENKEGKGQTNNKLRQYEALRSGVAVLT